MKDYTKPSAGSVQEIVRNLNKNHSISCYNDKSAGQRRYKIHSTFDARVTPEYMALLYKRLRKVVSKRCHLEVETFDRYVGDIAPGHAHRVMIMIYIRPKATAHPRYRIEGWGLYYSRIPEDGPPPTDTYIEWRDDS